MTLGSTQGSDREPSEISVSPVDDTRHHIPIPDDALRQHRKGITIKSKHKKQAAIDEINNILMQHGIEKRGMANSLNAFIELFRYVN